MKKKIILNYNLGNACNLKCKFCYNDKERKEKQYYKTLEEINLDLIRLIKKSKSIYLIGGEPLFHPKIFDIINIIKELGFKEIGIVTNGIKLSEHSFAKKILQNYIDNIVFSFYSHNSRLDEKISGRKNIFNKRISGYKNVEKIKNELNINTNIFLNLVINKMNVCFISEIVDYYLNLGFLNISLYSMLMNKNFTKENLNIIPSYKNIITNIKKIRRNKNLFLSLHWAPLCIGIQLNNIDMIREVDLSFIFNINSNSRKLFSNHVSNKVAPYKCKKCYAYGKFCFGIYKHYYKIYGDTEFKPINKYNLYAIIKKYSYNFGK